MPTLSRDKPGATLSDADLIEPIVAGDSASFEPLMRRHNRLLFRTARSIAQNDADTEDVLQSAYLKAYSTLASFRGAAQLSTWLVRIVLNEALARVRKTQRRAGIIHLEPCMDEDLIVAHDDDRGSGSVQPQVAAMRARTRRLLEHKIEELPEAFLTVFMLRVVEEMSVEEVSEVLGIAQATVRTRHFRGRSMLREALSREVDFAMEEAFGFDGERCNRIVASVFNCSSIPDQGSQLTSPVSPTKE